jgi:hypothetical protein
MNAILHDALDPHAPTICTRCGGRINRCKCADIRREPWIDAAQAFQDEMERQRAEHGWTMYPRPPVAEWPRDEQNAGIAALRAAIATLARKPEPL